MRTVVVHISQPHDVVIMRPSKWGNPFKIGRDGTRKEVIDKYRKWLPKQKRLMRDIHELKGKRIACCCKPLPCHGDVLAEFADRSK